VLKKELPRARQARATSGAVEQQYTQVFLQFLDRARQRRLLNMKPGSCSGEMKLLRNSDEAS